MKWLTHIHHHVIKGTVLWMTAVMLTALCAGAQEPDRRHVTPVKPETNQVKPPPKGTAEKVIQQYISGDSAAAMQEAVKDSLRRIYKRYPSLTDMAIGVNFAEPVFMAFGQSYASADVNFTLNMWNRFQPTVELGLGWAKTSPDDMNFTYKGKPAPYFKVGANYNFLFKNSPDHQVLLGLRLGYSPFSYDVTGARFVDGTWKEDENSSFAGEHSHALWGEAGLGLKVKLFGPLSMGWMIRYHGVFNYAKNTDTNPWFIPGYGPRSSSLGFSMSIFYTLPLHRDQASDNESKSQP